ncbi:hypothetical protein NEOLEDRAFT_1150698 [Neolentinus lepideus HHB14362 ss-1]|uniref:Uncharacterized protein n=1 Tax=Neolentinus lepideus HHB14362 ss-1 TaxID=1314782 RepID=A0A165PQU5_9AGAM|nr:hypothetical protein NEOLEDRAFT_1150698 [Neolentinus lepideus HHB14362 ss-1]
MVEGPRNAGESLEEWDDVPQDLPDSTPVHRNKPQQSVTEPDYTQNLKSLVPGASLLLLHRSGSARADNGGKWRRRILCLVTYPPAPPTQQSMQNTPFVRRAPTPPVRTSRKRKSRPTQTPARTRNLRCGR